MAFYNEAWFIHAVNDNVTQLAQQKKSQVMGAVRTKEGVVGKTEPFQRIGAVEMQQQTVRDGTTQFLNPPQSKRRAILKDFAAAVLIDDFDKVKELAEPQSEFAAILGYARNRKLDDFVVAVVGLTAAGAAQTEVGGALGLATTVDEAAETTSTSALPAAQQIVNGGTGATMAKLRTAKFLMDDADVDPDDRYLFYSPKAISQLLADSTVTSADFQTLRALEGGGFPMDHKWMGFYWRMSTRLPKTGNIRSLIALQKMAVGLGIGLMTDIKVNENPERWNNIQTVTKLSGGGVRIDDKGVVQLDIDESV